MLGADIVNRNLLTPYRCEIQLKGAVYAALYLPEQRSTKKVEIFLDWLTSSRLSLSLHGFSV